MYYNKNAGNPNAWTYDPDFSRQAFRDRTWENGNLRLTAQITPRNKLNLFWDEQRTCRSCENGGNGDADSSPEAGSRGEQPIVVRQAAWTSTLSNKVLLEVGDRRVSGALGRLRPEAGSVHAATSSEWSSNARPAVPANGNIPGLTYRSQSNDLFISGLNLNSIINWRANVSYVTGAHSFKAGYASNLLGDLRSSNRAPNNLDYRVNNGVPNQFTMWINNFQNDLYMRDDGFFAQEHWTHKRLTLQGARAVRPRRQLGAAAAGGPRPLPAAADLLSRDADRGQLQRRHAARGGGLRPVRQREDGDQDDVRQVSGGGVHRPGLRAAATRPRASSRASVASWTDANSNLTPDCDLLNPERAGPARERRRFLRRVLEPQLRHDDVQQHDRPEHPAGLGRPPVGLESRRLGAARSAAAHVGRGRLLLALVPGLPRDRQSGHRALLTSTSSASWRRRIRACRMAAATRCPICTTSTPSLFGITNNYVTFSDTYGNQYAKFNGLDITLNARPTRNLTIQGGFNGGKTISDNCEIRAKLPEIAPLNPYCHVETGYLPHYKWFGSYMVPKVDVQVGLTFTSKPGLQVSFAGTPTGGGHLSANYTVANAVVAQSLGRNLAGNAANVDRQSDRAGLAVRRSHQRARSSRGENREVRPIEGEHQRRRLQPAQLGADSELQRGVHPERCVAPADVGDDGAFRQSERPVRFLDRLLSRCSGRLRTNKAHARRQSNRSIGFLLCSG